MPRNALLAVFTLIALASPALAGDVWVEGMDLSVTIDPATHRIDGKAVLYLAPERTEPATLAFRLHKGLKVSPPKGAVFTKNEEDGWWRLIEIEVPPSLTTLDVVYEGTIYDAVEKASDLDFVVGDNTRGVIGNEGVFLVAGSGWYPVTDGVVTFRKIAVSVPESIRAVTQGALAERKVEGGRERTLWTNDRGMDGVALQAGKYVVETREVKGVKISTYLFESEAKYSKLFLDESQRYLEFYAPILGAYPWPKFDIVENFFTTGYGMPSFTLLGKDVMPVMVMMSARNKGRIPPGYIDHEMVHCWWGNYVYPDYESGNWCEGLTSWYSNYLMKDATDPKLAKAHREKISTTYSIRVSDQNDYPLREFRGKTEDFENDIGYGKCCMVFHMLATRVGYETFFETMRGVVRDFGGKKCSWEDFEAAFSKSAGEDLSWYFEQWLDRKGAPRLSLGEVSVSRGEDGLFHVKSEIVQDRKPWRLRVPVTVEHAGGEAYHEFDVAESKTAFEMISPRMPISVSIDKRFHLFRHVPLDEIQPCMNLTLSRPDKAYVVPEGNETYARLASMSKGGKGGEIVSAADGLPAKDCILYGRPDENPAVAKVLAAAGVKVEGNSVTIKGKKHEGENLWLLLSTRHPEASGKFTTVFFGMTPKALGRARVIFHYGWDGFLVYAGRRPLARGEFTEISPRAVKKIHIEADPARVEKTMRTLAAPGWKGRRTGSKGAAEARKYLAETLRGAGADSVAVHATKFTVLDFDDDDAWTVAQGKLEDGKTEWKTSYPGAVVPAIFSKAAPDGVRIRKIVTFPAKADRETLLVLPPEENVENLTMLLSMLVDSEAAAIAIPMSVLTGKDRRMADLVGYPSRKHEKPLADPWRMASGQQARAYVPPFSMPMPVVFVDPRLLPPGGAGDADALLRVRFTMKEFEIRSLIADFGDAGNGRAIGLCAHYDGCGEGYPSVDDNASGVAAVLETSRALGVRKDMLGRAVRVFLTDGEEWGLRGAAVLAADERYAVSVLVNLDTVGAADQSEVFLIGRTHYADLSARAAVCLETEGFAIGRDIDKFAFAYGSDHWPFHRRRVPVIDLWSGQYRRMNSKDDTIDKVDIAKVARISAATTRLVLDLASKE